MCQVGALGRARAGQTYRQILTTYYPHTQVARSY
jgi:peptidoglycan hydrolase-like amidase